MYTSRQEPISVVGSMSASHSDGATRSSGVLARSSMSCRVEPFSDLSFARSPLKSRSRSSTFNQGSARRACRRCARDQRRASSEALLPAGDPPIKAAVRATAAAIFSAGIFDESMSCSGGTTVCAHFGRPASEWNWSSQASASRDWCFVLRPSDFPCCRVARRQEPGERLRPRPGEETGHPTSGRPGQLLRLRVLTQRAQRARYANSGIGRLHICGVVAANSSLWRSVPSKLHDIVGQLGAAFSAAFTSGGT